MNIIVKKYSFYFHFSSSSLITYLVFTFFFFFFRDYVFYCFKYVGERNNSVNTVITGNTDDGYNSYENADFLYFTSRKKNPLVPNKRIKADVDFVDSNLKYCIKARIKFQEMQ